MFRDPESLMHMIFKQPNLRFCDENNKLQEQLITNPVYGSGNRSSFTGVSYDHVSSTSPRLFLFVCLDQFKKKCPTSQNRECFPLELEANTVDGFNICWTMRGWVVGTSHSFVTNMCVQRVRL